MDWLKDGDLNTKFFYRRATMRKRKNKISKLKNSNGDWVYDQEEIERMAKDYYSNLFTSYSPTGIEEVMEAVECKMDVEMDYFLNLPFTSWK